tara:strand:- start:820 stop:1032 length:213 start_codon:yes stop_codon:yes gene_type:complete
MLIEIPEPDDKVSEGDVLFYIKTKEGSEECYVIELTVWENKQAAADYCDYVRAESKGLLDLSSEVEGTIH